MPGRKRVRSEVTPRESTHLCSLPQLFRKGLKLKQTDPLLPLHWAENLSLTCFTCKVTQPPRSPGQLRVALLEEIEAEQMSTQRWGFVAFS